MDYIDTLEQVQVDEIESEGLNLVPGLKDNGLAKYLNIRSAR